MITNITNKRLNKELIKNHNGIDFTVTGKNKVTYIDLISEGTVDEKIVQSLRSKIDIATEVMGEQVKQWVIEPIRKRK